MKRMTAVAAVAITLALPATVQAAPIDRLERAVDTVVICTSGVADPLFTYTVAPYQIRLWAVYCDGIFRSMMADPPIGPTRPLDAAVIYGWQAVAIVYQAVTCVKFGIGCSTEAGGAEYTVNSPNVVPRLLADAGIGKTYAKRITRAVERATWGTP